MNHFGIDLMTCDKRKMIGALRAVKDCAMLVRDGGIYTEDRRYGCVFVHTSWTEKELDDWLYNTKHGVEYLGIFTLKGK